MSSISRNNHYIPQLYLKRWSKNGKIQDYKLLVSDNHVPTWNSHSIKKVGSQKNLYVRLEDNAEYDDIEHWLDKEFENPANNVIDKICAHKELTADEWTIIINFAIAQYVRTPSFYQYVLKFGKEHVPSILDEVTNNLSSLTQDEIEKHEPIIKRDASLLPLTIKETNIHPDENHTILEVGTVVGKNMWLMAIKHFLSSDSIINQYIHSFKWSIAYSDGSCAWPTTDNPFTIAKYTKSRGFDLIKYEGIGHKKVAIIFPLAPNTVIIGSKNRYFKRCFTADNNFATMIKKCIVDNAFMHVYAREEDSFISKYRARTVNEKAYRRITEEYNKWYDTYKELEAPLLSSKRVIKRL